MWALTGGRSTVPRPGIRCPRRARKNTPRVGVGARMVHGAAPGHAHPPSVTHGLPEQAGDQSQSAPPWGLKARRRASSITASKPSIRAITWPSVSRKVKSPFNL